VSQLTIRSAAELMNIAPKNPELYKAIPLTSLTAYSLYWLHAWELRPTIAGGPARSLGAADRRANAKSRPVRRAAPHARAGDPRPRRSARPARSRTRAPRFRGRAARSELVALNVEDLRFKGEGVTRCLRRPRRNIVHGAVPIPSALRAMRPDCGAVNPQAGSCQKVNR
jgi:hypothetical protein